MAINDTKTHEYIAEWLCIPDAEIDHYLDECPLRKCLYAGGNDLCPYPDWCKISWHVQNGSLAGIKPIFDYY